MGTILFLSFLLMWSIPPSVSYNRCAACVDKKIDYNWDVFGFIKIPSSMPNCSPSIRPKKDPTIPRELWIVRCEHSCVSLDWYTNGIVTDRMRHCSTGLFRNGENMNITKKLPVMEINRYPGIEIRVHLCNAEDLCNYDDGLIPEAYEWKYNETTPTITTAMHSTSTQATEQAAPTTTDLSSSVIASIATTSETLDTPNGQLENSTSNVDNTEESLAYEIDIENWDIFNGQLMIETMYGNDGVSLNVVIWLIILMILLTG